MAKPIRRSLARRLGHNMGDCRRAGGLTQEQLAEYLDIATLTVSRYEIGLHLLSSNWSIAANLVNVVVHAPNPKRTRCRHINPFDR